LPNCTWEIKQPQLEKNALHLSTRTKTSGKQMRLTDNNLKHKHPNEDQQNSLLGCLLRQMMKVSPEDKSTGKKNVPVGFITTPKSFNLTSSTVRGPILDFATYKLASSTVCGSIWDFATEVSDMEFPFKPMSLNALLGKESVMFRLCAIPESVELASALVASSAFDPVLAAASNVSDASWMTSFASA